MNPVLPDLLKIFQATAQSICNDIASAQSQKNPFVVAVGHIEEFDIAIIAGYPPTIQIDPEFISKSIFIEKELERKRHNKRFRRLLSLAISKLPRMERSLAIQPLAEIIAIKDGMRRFAKTNHKDLLVHTIPPHHLKIDELYTVSVTEITTGQNVTLSGDNQALIREQAISQLTLLVSQSETLAKQLEEESYNPEPKPSLIQMKINQADNIEVKSDYDSNV